jgi:hypothetical protein
MGVSTIVFVAVREHTCDAIRKNHTNLGRIYREALTSSVQADAKEKDVAAKVEPHTEPSLHKDDSAINEQMDHGENYLYEHILRSVLHIDPRLGFVQKLTLCRSVSGSHVMRTRGAEPLGDKPAQTKGRSGFLNINRSIKAIEMSALAAYQRWY